MPSALTWSHLLDKVANSLVMQSWCWLDIFRWRHMIRFLTMSWRFRQVKHRVAGGSCYKECHASRQRQKNVTRSDSGHLSHNKVARLYMHGQGSYLGKSNKNAGRRKLLESCTRSHYVCFQEHHQVSNSAFTRAPVCSLYVGLTTLANRRRSDGARLAGRHGFTDVYRALNKILSSNKTFSPGCGFEFDIIQSWNSIAVVSRRYNPSYVFIGCSFSVVYL